AVVRIGRNGPRYSLGASGLRSKVSSWLGPPHIQKRITEVGGGVAAPRAATTSASVSPPSARLPTRKKLRRDTGPRQLEGIASFSAVTWPVWNINSPPGRTKA